MAKAKRWWIWAGGAAALVGLGFAFTGEANAAARDPFKKPLEKPTTDEEVQAAKTAICTCYRGGSDTFESLMICSLKQVYAEVPWQDVIRSPHAEDHTTVAEVLNLFSSWVDELLELPSEEAREAWCDLMGPGPQPPDFPDPTDDGPPDVPDPPAPPVSNYVGSGWDWRGTSLVGGGVAGNRFPTEASFGQALNSLGYATHVGVPGWSPIRGYVMLVVDHFQRDFNKVRQAAIDRGDGFPLAALVRDQVPLGNGQVGGLIGRNTTRAIAYAMQLAEESPGGWLELVALAS